MCGEHSRCILFRGVTIGSSPRVRGTQPPPLFPSICCRFIPACAGNTIPPQKKTFKNTVHPRVCGEHVIPSKCRRYLLGSSPRVRGTLFQGFFKCALNRFIPACAGNTSDIEGLARPISVHPRVCGEHKFRMRCLIGGCGSSPRVRGTPSGPPAPSGDARFIPACAGNTSP